VDRDGRIDWVPGTLERIGKAQLTFSVGAAGEDRVFSFSRDRVIAIRSAAVEPRPADAQASVITLQDGSRLTGTLRPSEGMQIAMKLSIGPEVMVDSRRIKSLNVMNASLRYLGDLDPAEYSETPLFAGVTPQGIHRDQGLRSGQPLRAGRQTFTKGILAPARSRTVYALDGRFSRFVATVGADAGSAGSDLTGSVRASILVDGRRAWTSGIMRAGQSPEVVEVGGLKDARRLVIEVDFGDSFDAGSRAVFGNAMLIR
jgi:hypothetical protein